MSRPAKYGSEEERREAIRAQTKARVARWISQHPRKWKKIMERAKAKQRRKGRSLGVNVKLAV
jgi:hypothetical protein